MSRRWGWLGGAAVAAAAALMASTAGASPTPAQVQARTDALAAARARWDRLGIDDYRYRIRLTCFCTEEARRGVTVSVRDGRARGTPPGFRSIDTVPRLFALVRRRLGDDTLTVRYDRARGVPRIVVTDPIAMAVDDEITYTVDRFARLRPP